MKQGMYQGKKGGQGDVKKTITGKLGGAPRARKPGAI